MKGEIIKMKIKMLIGVLILAVLATMSVAWTTNNNSLPAEVNVEGVVMTYAWSMDNLDKTTWLSVFSDNLESYIVYKGDTAEPLLMIPVPSVPPGHPLYGLTPKEQLAYLCDMMIFQRIVVAQSFLSNIVIDVEGVKATGKDYFSHWEIAKTDIAHWSFQEGKHWYKLAKEEATWKITKFEGRIYRTEARDIP